VQLCCGWKESRERLQKKRSGYTTDIQQGNEAKEVAAGEGPLEQESASAIDTRVEEKQTYKYL